MKLKPCPFCGNEVKKVNRITCEVDTSYHICSTPKCLYSRMIQGCEYDQWNTRPIEAKLQAENRELTEQLAGQITVNNLKDAEIERLKNLIIDEEPWPPFSIKEKDE